MSSEEATGSSPVPSKTEVTHVPESRTEDDYVHITNDPKPPGQNDSDELRDQYPNCLMEYAIKWCTAYSRVRQPRPEVVWADFTTDFSLHGLKNLQPTEQVSVRDVLLNNGVHVTSKRGFPRIKAFMQCWEAEKCPIVVDIDSNDSVDNRESRSVGASIGLDARAAQNPAEGRQGTREQRSHEQPRGMEQSALDPNEGSFRPVSYRGSSFLTGERSFHSTALSGLSKAYAGRKKYSGSWDEDLLGAIEIYEMACRMCELDENQMRRGVMVMLEGDAMAYYASNLKDAKTYETVIDGLKAWYTSEEQRSRLLQEWQACSLTSRMRKSPEKSEIAVFRDLCASLGKIQRQLHSDYRKDRFLKDQIVAAADIPHVARALREKVPTTSHEATQRIAALLSREPNSAGVYIADLREDDHAYYGLGQRYKGQAERRIGRSAGKSSRTPRVNRRSVARKLAMIQGCWVCGKEHQARKNHSEGEILAALAKHKENGVYLAADDIIEVFQVLMAKDDDDDSEDELPGDDGMMAEEVCEINAELERSFANSAFLHGSGFSRDQKMRMEEMERGLRDESQRPYFKGSMIDTGSNRSSIISLNQYQAYCREFSIPAAIDKSEKRSINGLGGKTKSVGSVLIPIPFPELGIVADVKFRVVEENVHTILCLRDMKMIGLDLSIQNNWLSFMRKTQKLDLENDLLFHRWYPDIVLYTTSELLKLHRSFGHPSISALSNVLKRARPEEMNSNVQKEIEQLTERCRICSELEKKPKRFKLTLGNEDSRLNHCLAVDIMYIQKRPILHLVDEATHFQAACFMKNVSSKETWKAIMRCWCYVYMGPPDHLRIDQGSNFISKEFRQSASSQGIEIMEAPVESPNTMSHVERYHGPIRTAYERLEMELPSESKDYLLQMAVYGVNSTMGPEGLCPTLCVFGAIPRPARALPAPDQVARAEAIDQTMKDVEKEHARRRLQFGLRYKGPYGKEREDLDQLTFGAQVRVYRDQDKKWEGPFKFISKEGETVVVQLPHGRRIFRSNVVKPMEKNEINPPSDNPISEELINMMFDEKDCMCASVEENQSFSAARQREIRGLMDAGVFEIVDRDQIPQHTRIYGTRWVDVVKKGPDGREIQKSRLVAQNYRDFNAKHIPTKAPTVSRMGQRLALTVAAMQSNGIAFVRDVTQAYVQSKSELERDVYLRPVPELNLPSGKVLRAVKPLYGVPEAGLHWFITYRDHHENNLDMESCTVDKCILYRMKNTESVPDVVILQVDDTFGSGSEEFLREEESNSRAFLSKPRKVLSPGDGSTFNGAYIMRDSRSSFTLTQREKMEKLQEPETSDEAVSTRAQIQYIAASTRPDLASPSHLLASEVNNPTRTTYRRLKQIVNYCHDTKKIGLRFVSLDVSSLRIVLFTDSSFANGPDLSSQLGFIIVLMDDSGSANVVHYGSHKSRRITRSVMAAELLALVTGFDNAFVVKYTVDEMLGRNIPVDVFVDSRTTFNCVAKHAPTLEKRLQIDVNALRQSHSVGEIRCIGWIPGHLNPADGLTRERCIDGNHALFRLMKSNEVIIQAEGWAEMRDHH